MSSKGRRPRKVVQMSANKLTGWPATSRIRLYADDMAGAFCHDRKSVTFYARGYDNYGRRTGLHVQHELTFRHIREANRFVRWLNAVAQQVKSKD